MPVLLYSKKIIEMKAKFLSLLFLLFISHCVTAQVAAQRATKVEPTAKITDLDDYKGHYTSDQDPDGIVFSVQNDKLQGKIENEPTITFEHMGRNIFKSKKAGIIVSFTPDKKQVALQRKEGTAYLFRKQ